MNDVINKCYDDYFDIQFVFAYIMVRKLGTRSILLDYMFFTYFPECFHSYFRLDWVK